MESKREREKERQTTGPPPFWSPPFFLGATSNLGRMCVWMKLSLDDFGMKLFVENVGFDEYFQKLDEGVLWMEQFWMKVHLDESAFSRAKRDRSGRTRSPNWKPVKFQVVCWDFRAALPIVS